MLQEADVSKMLVDGDTWANWQGYHLPVSDDYICIWTPQGTKKHWKPDKWKPQFFYAEKHTLSYMWPGDWFAIHISYHADGSFASGYCDVTLPIANYTSQTQEIIYIDLYIDVVIRQDGSVYTKDQEVYERAARKYPIVADSYKKAYEVLDWMELHARSWSGPFAVMPKQLPRTDWGGLSVAEIRAVMQQSVE